MTCMAHSPPANETKGLQVSVIRTALKSPCQPANMYQDWSKAIADRQTWRSSIRQAVAKYEYSHSTTVIKKLLHRKKMTFPPPLQDRLAGSAIGSADPTLASSLMSFPATDVDLTPIFIHEAKP